MNFEYVWLDIDSWSRKDQFFFFKNYDNPFFNICSEVDVTELLDYTKQSEGSFFIASLYVSLKAANGIAEFRYRIRDDKVIVHEKIHGGSTVLNEDESFSFCYFTFSESFGVFSENARAVLAANLEKKGVLNPRLDDDSLIHHSIIPWISFSGLSHPRRYGKNEDSIPKIVFGKHHQVNNRVMMPISVEVHHSLMDGLHVSKYLSLYEEIAGSPQIYL